MEYENRMKLEFDSRSANEGFARVAVAAFLSQMNPTLEEVADVKTALSEAVTNCVVHAYEIKRFLRDDGMIKVSRSLKENALKVFTARERLEKRLGREPAMQELSEETGLSGEDIVMAIESATEVDSIYRTIYQGDGNAISLADRLEEKDNPNERLLDHMVLQEVMATLEEREKRLIEMRYFEEKTQNQVAAALSMTQVQVSRMEKKILKKMRGRFF